MRFIALIALFLFIATCAHAQLSEKGLIYLKKSEKYGRMKNTGRTLVFTGTVLVVIGVVTIVKAVDSNNNTGTSSSQTTQTENVDGAFAAYVIGNIAINAGVPLWIVGGINQKRYAKKLELDSYNNSFNGSINRGITLRLRF